MAFSNLDDIYSYAYWRHCIPLGDGNFTPGVRFSNNWERLHFPKDMSGMSFLDVGANDGMYCFLAEEKGAKKVVATDIYHNDIHNWEMTMGWPVYGIQAVKQYKKSNVEIISSSLFDLDFPEKSFDYVFCGNVIIWLNDPYSAHLKLASIASNILHIREDMFVNDLPAQLRFSKLSKSGNANSMFAANKNYYREVLTAAGFKRIDFYEIDEELEWREFIQKCPKIIAPKGIDVFTLPQQNQAAQHLSLEKTGRISAEVNGKCFVVGIGWLNKTDLQLIPEDSTPPSQLHALKRDFLNWKNKNNRQGNFSIIAQR